MCDHYICLIGSSKYYLFNLSGTANHKYRTNINTISSIDQNPFLNCLNWSTKHLLVQDENEKGRITKSFGFQIIDQRCEMINQGSFGGQPIYKLQAFPTHLYFNFLSFTTKESNPISKTYHGMTGGTFKKRYGGHKSDFKHKDKYGTTLSRHIWRLRDMNVKYSIKWEIKEKAPIYKPGAKECKLCNAEKYHILMEDYKQSLNCRSELLSKCRHKSKWKLVKLL